LNNSLFLVSVFLYLIERFEKLEDRLYELEHPKKGSK